jgi:hypothetical protein
VSIIDLLFKLLHKIFDRKNLRWGIDLFESLLDIPKTELLKLIDNSKLNEIIDYSKKSIAYFKQQRSYNIAESYTKFLLEINKIFNPDKVWDIEKQLILDIIEEGNNHPMHLAKAGIYENALKKAQDLGFSEFFDDLKQRIRENYKVGMESEMAIISPGEDILNEIQKNLDIQIQEFIQKTTGKTTESQIDVLLNLFNLPSYDYWKNYTETNPNPSVIQQILPTHLLNHELSKGTFTQNEQKIIEIQTNFNREVSLLISQIFRVFKILTINEDFYYICKNRIKKNKYFTQNTSNFLLYAIDLLKKSDFRSAYPFLLFIIEQVLRDILRINKVGDFIQNANDQEFYIGKSIFNKIREKKLLDSNYCYIWELTFFDPNHSNYRNAFAHGFQIFDAISPEITVFLLYLYLKLPICGAI